MLDPDYSYYIPIQYSENDNLNKRLEVYFMF